MDISDIDVRPVDEGNSESTARFLIEWVNDGEAEARSYLADHAEPDGASLIATGSSEIIGYVAIVWESDYPDSAAAAFRWFTRSRWPGRSCGRAPRHC